ncbi:MAG: response regulator [Deltaproteobacteria bacterium]|nr:response regulator [Deltaproteobacteria bacterium]
MNFESHPRYSELGKNNKILLLDPDEAIQLLYRDELSEEGYEVIPVTEAAQIIRYIEAYEPALLVMETGLYGRNGLRLLQDIRRAHPDLPVIVCTADASFKMEPNVQIADDVVLKGMSVLELKESIKNLLSFKSLVSSATASYPTGGDTPLKRIHKLDAKHPLPTTKPAPAIGHREEY